VSPSPAVGKSTRPPKWIKSQPGARRCENQGPPELVAGLGAGLELGRAETLSFVSVVIALYLVPGAI